MEEWLKQLLRPVVNPIRSRLPALRRFVPLLKHVRRQAEKRKLKRLGCEKLNFGCGANPLPNWTNIDGGDGRLYLPPPHPDVVKLDVFDALTHIDDETVRLITSEQFFEHFDRHEGHGLLREWYRVLQPGGVLRIQTPDLQKEVKIYLGMLPDIDWETTVLPHRTQHVKGSADTYGRLEDGEQYTRAMLLNNGMHMDGHQCLYDFEMLSQSLRLAGFRGIKRVAFGKSEHAELAGIDRHDGGETGRHWIPTIVLTIEAIKPLA